jgi:hypothetical protein
MERSRQGQHHIVSRPCRMDPFRSDGFVGGQVPNPHHILVLREFAKHMITQIFIYAGKLPPTIVSFGQLTRLVS